MRPSNDKGVRCPVIHIAAALIDDGLGRIFLVRKSGTTNFLQAGGKIHDGELPLEALRREILEELGVLIDPYDAKYLGHFSAEAANEPGHFVKADLFHLRICGELKPLAELEEARWVDFNQAGAMQLAPLTRYHVLPLAALL